MASWAADEASRIARARRRLRENDADTARLIDDLYASLRAERERTKILAEALDGNSTKAAYVLKQDLQPEARSSLERVVGQAHEAIQRAKKVVPR